MVKFVFHGRTLHLLFNGNLLYELQDLYGAEETVFSICAPNTQESHRQACEIVALMAEQGELLRRYMGHEAEETPDAEWFLRVSSYADTVIIKDAVCSTAAHDIASNEIEEEVDLGLLELEAGAKKKSIQPQQPISGAE